MKRKKISETIENINPKYIDEAVSYEYKTKNRTSKIWYKWVAAAACIALMIAIGIQFSGDLFLKPNDKTVIDSVIMIEYEGAYFEVIEDSQIIEKLGLKKEITENMIGRHIAYLQKKTPNAERSDYITANIETDVELFEYSPAPYKAVRIFKNDDKYYFALFCNYLVKTNESLPIQNAFEVYGIYESSQIARITPVKNDNTWEPDGKAITDSAAIADFFDKISVLTAFCFDDYHNLVFADELKNLEQTGGDIGSEAYARVADDRKDIIIETKDGLRFAIQYYPSYGWINIHNTLSYYQMSPEISEWFSNNVK